MNWLRLHVSNVCNFKCPNCHVFEMTENLLPSQLMSEEIFVKSIQIMLDYLVKNKQKDLTVSLYGGETLANKKIIKKVIENQISWFNSQIKVKWQLNTNGSLLTEEDAAFFKEHNVEIHLSIDGKEHVHNLSRKFHNGEGTYQKVLNALKLINQYQIPAQINSYLMPTNLDSLKDIVEIASENNIKRIYIDQCYSEAMTFSEELFQKYLELYLYSLSHNISLYGPWTRVMQNFEANISRLDQLNQNTVIDINVDGSLYSSTLPNLKATPINFQQIEHFINFEYPTQIEQQIQLRKTDCRDCPIAKECGGIAKEQVTYHIHHQADTAASCSFFKHWINYLNQPLYYYNNFEHFDIVSLYPIDNLGPLIDSINKAIAFLETRLWKIENKFHLHIVKNFYELKYAAKQLNLPSWAKATTTKQTLFHLGTNPCEGLTHELVHIFLNQKIGHCPQWIQEGFCEWINNQTSQEGFKSQINLNDLENSFLSQNLKSNPTSSVEYQTARHFFIYLEKLLGDEELCHFFRSNSNPDLNQWLLSSIGLTLNETYLNYQKFDW